MKEYAYERVEGRGFFSTNFDDYREIIDAYAREGYRFVTFIPAKIYGYGTIMAIDLVFERDTFEY